MGKIKVRHNKTGKINEINADSYKYVSNMYTVVEGDVNEPSTIKKKGDQADADADDELETVRAEYEKVFDKPADKRKSIETLKEEIEEAK